MYGEFFFDTHPPSHSLSHPSSQPPSLAITLKASPSLQGCDLASFLLAVEDAADQDAFKLGPGSSMCHIASHPIALHPVTLSLLYPLLISSHSTPFHLIPLHAIPSHPHPSLFFQPLFFLILFINFPSFFSFLAITPRLLAKVYNSRGREEQLIGRWQSDPLHVTVYCVTVQCSTVQCIALHCIALQCITFICFLYD